MTPALLTSTSKFALPGLGERTDRGEVGQIELADLPLARNARDRMLALGRVAHGEDDARASTPELASGGETDATVGARHQERAAIKAAAGPRRSTCASSCKSI